MNSKSIDMVHGLQKATVSDKPFKHARISSYFNSQLAKKLEEEWPKNFRHSNSSAEHYNLWDRSIVEHSRKEPIDDLTEVWHNAVDELLSKSYKDSVSELMNIPLDNCYHKVRLCEYHGNCWMLPHTDRSDRVVTHLIYLTPTWKAEWGGNLLLLRSQNEEDLLETITPEFNSSFIFQRTDNSWHSVQAVKPSVGVVRKTILSQFIRS